MNTDTRSLECPFHECPEPGPYSEDQLADHLSDHDAYELVMFAVATAREEAAGLSTAP